jgi:hypothetical protein
MALANMTQEETNNYNWEHCKRIAEELEEYANGNIYRCPECGQHCNVEEEENENGETVYKCSCGCTSEYEPEQLSIYDWAEDILDIEYRCGSDKTYRSVRIMVAYGGPNIYIDTATERVELYWWTDRASYDIGRDVAVALDDWAEEYWNCL